MIYQNILHRSISAIKLPPHNITNIHCDCYRKTKEMKETILRCIFNLFEIGRIHFLVIRNFKYRTYVYRVRSLQGLVTQLAQVSIPRQSPYSYT